MVDVLTSEQRKKCMSRSRSRNTRPELLLRKRLWKAGLRYRLRFDLPGKPDLVFPGAKVTLFIDGCFWHGCSIHYQKPGTNGAFWAEKKRANEKRDQIVKANLEATGWKVVRIWEHEIKQNVVSVVEKFLNIYLQIKAQQ